jgi:hypothetical protein
VAGVFGTSIDGLTERVLDSARRGLEPRAMLRNAGAGIVATGAMSAGMALGKALGLIGTPPPKHITARAEEKTGVEPHKQDSETFTATWLAAHVAYGAGSGVTYGVVQRLLPKSPAVAGLLYGGALWAVSYLGVMPALGLYPFPQKDDPSRVGVMIAVHGIYGETLAALAGGREG